jgi:endonuclease YncB( thermonuclease family)
MLAMLVITAFVLCADAVGHGGRVDKDGCHVDKSTGQRHCHGKSATTKPGSVCTGKVPVPGEEDVLYGRVVSVHDGDTFKVKIQGAAMTFRMSDIDAPELISRTAAKLKPCWRRRSTAKMS